MWKNAFGGQDRTEQIGLGVRSDVENTHRRLWHDDAGPARPASPIRVSRDQITDGKVGFCFFFFSKFSNYLFLFIYLFIFYSSLSDKILLRPRRFHVTVGPCGHIATAGSPGRASESSQRYRKMICGYCSRAKSDKRTDRPAMRGSCATRVVRPVAAALLHSAAI